MTLKLRFISYSTSISSVLLLRISLTFSQLLRSGHFPTSPFEVQHHHQRVYRAREEQYSTVRSPLIHHGRLHQIPAHLLPAAAGKGHQEASMLKVFSIILNIIHTIICLAATLITTPFIIHLTLIGSLYSPPTQYWKNRCRRVMP